MTQPMASNTAIPTTATAATAITATAQTVETIAASSRACVNAKPTSPGEVPNFA